MNTGVWVTGIVVLLCGMMFITGCTAGCQAWIFNREAAGPGSMADRVVEALRINDGDTVEADSLR